MQNCIRGQILSETKTTEIEIYEKDHFHLDKQQK